MAEGFAALVLAAGQGTRMKSSRPKVLHELLGRPMVGWPVGAALEAGADRCVVVVGHGGDDVGAALRNRYGTQVETAEQPEQRGTGDAVRCGMQPLSQYTGTVLILYGDCPLLRSVTLSSLLERKHGSDAPLGLVTMRLPDPSGYGRIIRDEQGRITAIREDRDCSETERTIDEVNPGVYACDAGFLRDALQQLSTNNAQGEIYLTDIVERAAGAGGVASIEGSADELRGVNDRHELAVAASLLRDRTNEAFARAGVTIRDPRGTWIDADSTIEPDAVIEPGVHLRGRCRIGARARVDVGCVLTDVHVAEDAYLKPYSVATESRIGTEAEVGPFAHLRADSELGPRVRVGNFVETKKTTFGKGSKANHLAYVGNGDIGQDVNIGAGTIFCNYDGFQKHTTTLEDGVFIGSDSQLVAPVRIGRGAYVASGSTIVRDVPADALAVARGRQSNKEGYASRVRQKKAAEAERAKKGE